MFVCVFMIYYYDVVKMGGPWNCLLWLPTNVWETERIFMEPSLNDDYFMSLYSNA